MSFLPQEAGHGVFNIRLTDVIYDLGKRKDSIVSFLLFGERFKRGKDLAQFKNTVFDLDITFNKTFRDGFNNTTFIEEVTKRLSILLCPIFSDIEVESKMNFLNIEIITTGEGELTFVFKHQLANLVFVLEIRQWSSFE